MKIAVSEDYAGWVCANRRAGSSKLPGRTLPLIRLNTMKEAKIGNLSHLDSPCPNA